MFYEPWEGHDHTLIRGTSHPTCARYTTPWHHTLDGETPEYTSSRIPAAARIKPSPVKPPQLPHQHLVHEVRRLSKCQDRHIKRCASPFDCLGCLIGALVAGDIRGVDDVRVHTYYQAARIRALRQELAASAGSCTRQASYARNRRNGPKPPCTASRPISPSKPGSPTSPPGPWPTEPTSRS